MLNFDHEPLIMFSNTGSPFVQEKYLRHDINLSMSSLSFVNALIFYLYDICIV